MRVAISVAIAGILLLPSCERAKPDSIVSLKSPANDRVVTVSSYQPRGIAKGYVLLDFEKGGRQSSEPAVLFQQIKNGQIGWITDDTIAITADQMKFNDMASDYFPDGTVDSRIRLVTCSHENMDCSSLERRWQTGRPTYRIASFPEG